MNFTLHQLRVFMKVVETQSITKAAEALHLTQPAVSIQLRKLQDQFEIPLTEVVGRQLYVTDFGKEIAEASERILEEVHAIKFKAMAYRGQLAGRIRISVVSTGKYVMPYFLSEFLGEHDGVDLAMTVTNKVHVVASLEKNEVDFALVSVLPAKLKIAQIPLMHNKLFLVGNRDAKWDENASPAEMFANTSLIFREQGSATRMAMERFLDTKHITVSKKITLQSNEAVKQAVLAGLGVSVMPIIGLKNELQNGSLRILPVEGLPIITDWNLIWLEKKKFSPAADAYLKFLREKKMEIISEKFSWVQHY